MSRYSKRLLFISCLSAVLVGFVACKTPSRSPENTPLSSLRPSAEIVAVGNAAPLTQYNRDLPGGGHVKGAHSGGWQITHALGVLSGNPDAVAKLKEQVLFSLGGENCFSANGGYPAQHERHLSGTYVLIKDSPFWHNELSAAAKGKMDLLMKAVLISSAYTTADATYEGDFKVTTLDGDPNMNRGWNPNFREGMFGGLIHATVYFGGVDNVYSILNTYDHEAFVRDLREAGLTNTWETFTWKAQHPDSPAPDGNRITRCIRDYHYKGKPLASPMDQLYALTTFTYDRLVNCGLNDGLGIDWNGVPTGTLVTGCENLPNKGSKGMLHEFDGRDAKGPRSSFTYAYDGFRPNLTNHTVVLVKGFWEPGPKAKEMVELLSVGIADLKFKLEHGYRNYAKGKGRTSYILPNDDWWRYSFETTFPLWFEILKPWHEREIQ